MLLLLLSSFYTNAQYFYKDIWNNGQLMKEFSFLKNGNLKTIKIKSFEDDGEPSEGFFCEKKINKNYTQSQMISRSYITGQSLLISDYSNEGRPLKTIDNTPTTTSTTQYGYDDKGKLTKVQTITKADDDSGSITETHEYFYDGNSPVKMLRKKNNILISTIHFVSDANGNVIEENIEVNNNKDKKYFYYYDDSNRLTDVVHFNETARRLLPNYMYEYNSLNQPKQMISTEEGGNNYFIWQYTYNDKNLRETEKCFSKEKRLLGSIEYEYK
ncbi:MAG: hypothetical protein ABI834_01990 [Ginsengibacter sp.]